MGRILVAGVIFSILAASLACGAEEGLDPMKQWGQWRGPLGTGVAPHGDPPGDWSETKNVKWKLALPGLGHASPVVWGDVIILHSAVATENIDEDAPKPDPGAKGGRRMPIVKTNKIHEFVVLAVNRGDGKVLWATTVCEEAPVDPMYATGSWASGSPITDGEHIFS
jgi:hypothetical protein